MDAVRKVTIDDDLAWFRRGTQELRLADALDASDGAAMTVGFARYAAGEANEWTLSYDEALIVTRGRFAVDTGASSLEAGPGEVIYLTKGTSLVYRAIEDVDLVYVSYPHWHSATMASPYAAELDEFVPDVPA